MANSVVLEQCKIHMTCTQFPGDQVPHAIGTPLLLRPSIQRNETFNGGVHPLYGTGLHGGPGIRNA